MCLCVTEVGSLEGGITVVTRNLYTYYTQYFVVTLDTSKASGPDVISIHMLKSTATNVAPSLAKLFDMSIHNGCFPACWKQLVLSCSTS